MYSMFGPQLVALFWDVVEILGDRAYLEEVDPRRCDFKGCTWSSTSQNNE
jgi:hypothetical protein